MLDADNPEAIERYVVARGLVPSGGLPVEIGRAGAGNMNLALRVTPAVGEAFIVKQGRPWVEKYKQIPAPIRTHSGRGGVLRSGSGQPARRDARCRAVLRPRHD